MAKMKNQNVTVVYYHSGTGTLMLQHDINA